MWPCRAGGRGWPLLTRRAEPRTCRRSSYSMRCVAGVRPFGSRGGSSTGRSREEGKEETTDAHGGDAGSRSVFYLVCIGDFFRDGPRPRTVGMVPRPRPTGENTKTFKEQKGATKRKTNANRYRTLSFIRCHALATLIQTPLGLAIAMICWPCLRYTCLIAFFCFLVSCRLFM